MCDGNDYMTLPNVSSLGFTDAITLIAWVQTSDRTISQQMIFDKRVGTTEYNYRLLLDSGYLEFAFYNGGHKSIGDDTTRLVNNTWAMVTAVYARADIYLYVDGAFVKKSGTNTLPMIPDASILSIGRENYNPGRYFEGILGGMWAYNRGLSEMEITYIHNQTKWRYR